MTRKEKIRYLTTLASPDYNAYEETVNEIKQALKKRGESFPEYLIHKAAHRIRKRMPRLCAGKWVDKYSTK